MAKLPRPPSRCTHNEAAGRARHAAVPVQWWGRQARTELDQIFSSPTIVSSEDLDFITCSWVRSRYLRTSSLPPPGLYSPKEDLRAHAVSAGESVRSAPATAPGREGRSGGMGRAEHARVRELVDLGNLRREVLGGLDPRLKVDIVGQLVLCLREQLVQREERVVHRAQPKVEAHLVGCVLAFGLSLCRALGRLLVPVVEQVVDALQALFEATHVIGVLRRERCAGRGGHEEGCCRGAETQRLAPRRGARYRLAAPRSSRRSTAVRRRRRARHEGAGGREQRQAEREHLDERRRAG